MCVLVCRMKDETEVIRKSERTSGTQPYRRFTRVLVRCHDYRGPRDGNGLRQVGNVVPDVVGPLRGPGAAVLRHFEDGSGAQLQGPDGGLRGVAAVEG